MDCVSTSFEGHSTGYRIAFKVSAVFVVVVVVVVALIYSSGGGGSSINL